MGKRNFIWNMLGSGVYSLATALFVLLAKRLVGEEAGAEFYMAYTTGHMLLTIGYFEIRPFQVTDVAGQYKPEEYFGFRSLTSGFMLLCGTAVGVLYVVSGRADTAGFGLILTMCLYKMCDGTSDVFEGEFQRNDRMDLSGKSMLFRTAAALAAFSVTAYLTKSIHAAAVSMAVVGIAGTFFAALVWDRRFERFCVSFERGKMKEMFRSTVLLFIASAMCMWIWNGTKYVVEWNLTSHETLVYGIVYMPTMVINLASSFIFKPMLTTFAKCYESGDLKQFGRILRILIGITCLIAAGTFVVAAWAGIPVLSWLYDIDLLAYRGVMMILIMAGGFNAVSIILYYALMVMRRQTEIFVGYTTTFVMSVVLPVMMVKRMGITGAALGYLSVMAILTALFSVLSLWNLKKCRKKKEEG